MSSFLTGKYASRCVVFVFGCLCFTDFVFVDRPLCVCVFVINNYVHQISNV